MSVQPLTAGRARSRLLAAAPAVVTLAVGLVLGLPATAWAHAQLVSVTPADASTLTVAPTRVVLVFDENIQRIGDAVVVTGPDGRRVDDGAPGVFGATATERLRPLVYRGRYTVSYRVVSDDGHPVTATLGFTLATGRPLPAAASKTSAGPSAAPGSPRPGWQPALFTAALAALVAGLALRLHQGRQSR